MKRFIIFSLIQLGSYTLYAQPAKSTVEQYCQLIVTPRLLSNKVTVDIDFGEEKSIWRDERLRTYDGKLKKFNTVVDALNYMGRDGWVFINAYPVTNGGTTIYHFAFKKEFPLEEARQ